ncbi:hypothetical protein OF83DRAFT_1171660 [Amylostereum chailletii]|nr:hypothetical protein OF83DRAFT_1171660 [Amylostereum chailletii]
MPAPAPAPAPAVPAASSSSTPRPSTSSTSTSRRLRTKTSGLSDIIRHRRDSNSTPPSPPALPSPPLASELPAPKPRRRIPFLSLRRKPDPDGAGTASKPQSGTGSRSSRLSHTPSPKSPNAHPPSPPPLPSKSPLAIPKSPPAFTRSPGTRSSSPVTLTPSRSLTPTAPQHGVQSPSYPSFPTSTLSPLNPPLTSPTRLTTNPKNGPTITVSSPSPDEARAPGLVDGSAANRSPSQRPPAQDGYVTDPSHPATRSSNTRLHFPQSSKGNLSDSDAGGAARQPPVRNRKSSIFDRLKGVRPPLPRSTTSQSSLSASDTHSSSTTPLTSAHTSKSPSETSQDLEAVLSMDEGMLTEVELPTSSSSSMPRATTSRNPSPASSVRRVSILPPPAKKTDTATSSRAVPLRTRERGSFSGGSGSESASSSRMALSMSRRNPPRPLARSATSVSKSPTPKRVSPPAGSSWLLTKPPVAPSADNDPSSSSSLKAPTPVTRARAASDSRTFHSPTNSVGTLSPGTGRRQRQSVNGDTAPSLRSAWQPSTTPPSGPLPAPPPEAPSSPTTSEASLSVSAPPRIASMLSTGSSSGHGSTKTLSTMSSTPSSLSSGGVSSTSSARTLATTASSESGTSRLSPSVPGTGRKYGEQGVVTRGQDDRSSTTLPTKKASPPSTPTSPVPKSPVATAQPLTPLAPTPSNIYALQTENATLKAKIESLERAARRHEREIRGLRWLVVNGTSASLGNFAGVGQPTQDLTPKTSPAQSSFTPSPPPMSPTSTDTEPLSDSTTDVGSPEGRDITFLMGSESDSGVSYGRAKSNGASSASDASGSGYFARKRPLALQRARQVREEAGKVLGRGLGFEFSVDVDLPREGELASIQETPSPVTPNEAPTVEVPSTEPDKPPERPSVENSGTEEAERRRLKEEKRASRALKRLSVASTASQRATLGTGEREGAGVSGDVHAAYTQNLARNRALSIEQVIEREREREERREREGLRGMDEVLEKLKTFAGGGKG